MGLAGFKWLVAKFRDYEITLNCMFKKFTPPFPIEWHSLIQGFLILSILNGFCKYLTALQTKIGPRHDLSDQTFFQFFRPIGRSFFQNKRLLRMISTPLDEWDRNAFLNFLYGFRGHHEGRQQFNKKFRSSFSLIHLNIFKIKEHYV